MYEDDKESMTWEGLHEEYDEDLARPFEILKCTCKYETAVASLMGLESPTPLPVRLFSLFQHLQETSAGHDRASTTKTGY